MSYSRNATTGTIQQEDKNDYYPFGLNFITNVFGGGSSFSPATTFKNWKFGSKELQETGFYDFGARFYMSDIAIFGTHDPLSEKTLQPYAYAYNNPIFFNDPTGMEGEAAANDDIQTGVDGDVVMAFGVRASDLQKTSGLGGMNVYNYGESTGTKKDTSKKNENSNYANLYNKAVDYINKKLSGSTGGNCCPDPNNNVKNIADVSNLEKSWLLYFENNDNITYYVKPEEAQNFGLNRVEVKPGKIYMGGIDGFASEKTGVIKVSDGVKVEIGKDGKAYYKTSIGVDIIHFIFRVEQPYKKLTTEDLKTFNDNKDHRWDELFFNHLKK